MSISLIINTAAAAPHAKHVLSSGKVPYSWRAYALKNFILPRYCSDPYIDEVIVSGIWEEGEGYKYVRVPPIHFNWADCIAQRQAGFEAASGDVLIFQHDDHVLERACILIDPRDQTTVYLSHYMSPEGTADNKQYDVLSPARYTRARVFAGERLNAGEAEKYIDGHLAIYRREVIGRCPWKEVPAQFTMDVAHTKQIRAAGFNIVHTDAVRCWDVERGSEPWK